MIPIHYSDKGLYLYYDSYSDLPQKALYVYIRMSTGYYIYKSGRKKPFIVWYSDGDGPKIGRTKKNGLKFYLFIIRYI